MMTQMCLRTLLVLAVFLDSALANLECPKDWIEFKGTVSCYKFQRYPLMNIDDARVQCESDGARLVAVESINEDMFIKNWLRKNDIEQRQWYTSGQEIGDRWTWTSLDAVFSYEQGFLPQTPFDQGSNLVYEYRMGVWGWVRNVGTAPSPFICEIPIQDAYKIINNRRDIDYGMESTVEVRFIPRGPKIIEQPEDIEFGKLDPTVLGSTYTRMKNEIIVKLNCLAEGYPIPIYEWFKGQIDSTISEYEFYPVDLSDPRYFQHGGNLIIQQPKSEDSGSYFCKASNFFGNVNSNIMQLREIVLDRFEKRERPPVIARGYREAVINCLYNNKNTEDINYIWFFNSLSQKVQQSRQRFISRNGNLYFSRVTNGDAGNYICAVATSNPELRYVPSQTSEYTYLSVAGSQGSERDPRIWINFPQVFPNRKLPRIGTNATIECIAEGYPIPDYKWYRIIEGKRYNLPKKAILMNLNRVVLLPDLQREDVGLYECHVQNYRNSHNRTVLLQLEIQPLFTVPIEDQVMDVGANLDWYCEATGNIGALMSYLWYINGTKIIDTTGRIRADNNVLHITDVQKTDSGMYQCAALNTRNSITRFSTAELRVIEFEPTFVKRPMEGTVRAAINGNATIVCNPEGAPQPTIQWYRNQQTISNGGRFIVLANGNLIIQRVNKMDEGNFTCEASNKIGKAAGYTTLYVVEGTMTENQQFTVVPANINQTFFLPCSARKPQNIDLTYIWQFNDEYLVLDNKRYAQDNIMKPGDLRIIRAQYTMEGDYKCIAKTTVDEISIVYRVSVRGPPGPSAGVKCSKMGSTTGQVTFVAGNDHGDPILAYTIEANTDRNTNWEPVKENFTVMYDPKGEYTTNVTNLAAWSAYQFRVRSLNSFGFSEVSHPSDACNTNQDIPGAPPSNVSGGGGKIGDLKITWMPLPSEHWNGENLKYLVYFRKVGVQTAWQVREVPFNQNYYVEYIVDSAPYTPYDVQVSAINIRGEGPKSNITTVYTAEGIPRKPVTNVKCEPYNSTAILVTWDMIPEDDFSILQGKLLGYVVRYWRYGLEENTNYWRKRFLGQRSSAIIIGLEPNTVYFVRVRVFNSAGESVESQLFSHRTFRMAPQMPPLYVKVYQPERPKDRKELIDVGTDRKQIREMYRLVVEWRGISTNNDEEPLEGYYIKVWEYYQNIRNATIFYAPANADRAVIDNLFKNRNYRLRIQGWSVGGEGKLSSPLKEFRIDNDGRLLIMYIPDTGLLYFNAASQIHNQLGTLLPLYLAILHSIFNY